MPDTVEIIIKTIDESTANTKKVEGGLKDVLSTVSKVTAGIVALGVAAKKAFDLGKEGASMDVLAQSTKNLGVDVNKLQDAVGGTISKFGIMNAQATLLAGTQGNLRTALLDSSEELLKIAKAANAVNPALGTTEFLYESLGRGIKRNSPLILDNLGLTIKIGEANEAYAAQLGKTVDELTAEEQQMALLNETLRAGNVLMEQAEGVNTKTMDSYSKLEAAIKDSTDRGKMLIAEFLEPVISLMAENAESTNDYQQNLDYVREAIDRGIISQQFFNRLLAEGHDAGLDLGDSMEEAAEKVRGIEETREALNTYTMDLEKLAQAGREGVDPLQSLAGSVEDIKEEARSAEDAFNDLYDAANQDWAEIFAGIGEASRFKGEGGQKLIDFEALATEAETAAIGMSDGFNQQFAGVFEEAGKQGEVAAVMFSQAAGDIDVSGAIAKFQEMGMGYQEAVDLAAKGGEGWEKALQVAEDSLQSIIDLIDSLNGMSATASVQITGLPGWNGITPQATGGPLAPMALVGEQGPEMIINGVVVPSAITKQLMHLGLKPGKQFASGGTLYDGPLMDGIYTPETAPTGTRPDGRGGTDPGGASGSNNRPGRQNTKPGGASDPRSNSRDATPGGAGPSQTPPLKDAYVIAGFQNSIENLAQNFTNAVKAGQAENNQRLDKIYDQLKKQPTQTSQDAGFKSVMQEVNGQ